jgi:hypothetical protein
MHRLINISSMIAFMVGTAAVSMAAAFPVHEIGNGVRSMGLAGNVTALADDPSSSYWNPGGLSFLTQREVFLSLGYIGQTNNAMVQGSEYGKPLMRIRFSPAGILYPVPVERGGLALSLSVNNAFNFDDILAYSSNQINDQGESVATESDYRMYGGLNFWTLAGGLQVGPGVGVGVAVSLITGSENARFNFLRTFDGQVTDTLENDFFDRYERAYIGVDVRGGLLYRPNKNLRLGLRAVIPRWVSFEESIKSISPGGSGKENSEEGIKGDLYSSYEGAVGAAYELESLVFTVDIRGRLPYLLLRPIEDISTASDAAHVKAGIGGGIEFPLFLPTLTGRTAYSFDEYDTHRFVVQYDYEGEPDFSPDPSEPEMNIHSLAAGFSIDFPQVSLDFGYKFGWWRLITNTIIKETHLLHQAQMALAWRF